MNATKMASALPGRTVSNVVQVKRFKTSDALYKFMATVDNTWKMRTDLDLPSGHYKTRIDSKSIHYINVKNDKVYTFAR
jgi:hypothetical protein